VQMLRGVSNALFICVPFVARIVDFVLFRFVLFCVRGVGPVHVVCLSTEPLR
jgi:hypothetical protein